MVLTRADREWIEQRACAAGFELAGVASVPESADGQASEDDLRYTRWVDSGYAGEMEYLKRADEAGEYLRGDLRRSMPWARSVIVCAVNYNADAPRSIDPATPTQGWIARYAWSGREDSGAGSDYHDVLLSRLRMLEAELKLRFGAASTMRCYVDTGPLVERGLCGTRGRWLDRQEHLPDTAAAGLLAAAGSDCDVTGARPGRMERACGRPLRKLHALHRCLPHRCALRACARWRACDGCHRAALLI